MPEDRTGRLSLSGVLLELVDPFLPASRRHEDVESGILAAAEVWNATRPGTPGSERSEALREAEDLLRDFIRKRGRAKRVVDNMARRLRQDHPDIARRIVDVRFVVIDHGKVDVRVISSTAGDEDDDGALPPRVDRVGERIAEVLAGEPAASPIARRRALQALALLADAEPDTFERRGVDVWAAAAMHAAFQHLPPPGLTAPELAARFAVGAQTVGAASRRLRDVVDWGWFRDAKKHPLQGLADALEHQTSGRVQPDDVRGEADAAFRRVGGRERIHGSEGFLFDWFVESRGIPDQDAGILWHRFLIGFRDAALDRLRGGGEVRYEANPRRDEPLDADPGTLCIAFAPAMRDPSLGEATRLAVARYLAALFPLLLHEAVPPPFRELPELALLPILVLARSGELAGAELLAAVSCACASSLTSHGLAVTELAELTGMAARADGVPAPRRAQVVAALLREGAHAIDPRVARDCIEALAGNAELPLDLRRAALEALMPPLPDAPESVHFAVPHGARRHAALAWARLQPGPLEAARLLLDRAEASGDAALQLAAADLLRDAGDAIDDASLRPLLHRGAESRRASVRQEFYEIGLRRIGPEVLEEAQRDRAAVVRRWAAAQEVAGSGTEPDPDGGLRDDVAARAGSKQLGLFED